MSDFIPKFNIPPRAIISVLGHVTLSQSCMAWAQYRMWPMNISVPQSTHMAAYAVSWCTHGYTKGKAHVVREWGGRWLGGGWYGRAQSLQAPNQQEEVSPLHISLYQLCPFQNVCPSSYCPATSEAMKVSVNTYHSYLLLRAKNHHMLVMLVWCVSDSGQRPMLIEKDKVRHVGRSVSTDMCVHVCLPWHLSVHKCVCVSAVFSSFAGMPADTD